MEKFEKVVVKEEAGDERGFGTKSPDATNSNSGSSDESLDAAKSPASPNVKYKLRPRSAHARRLCDSDWSFDDIIRHKPRSSPLSRYRRKTANARERYRMRQINTAFESLRGVLPSWVCSRRAAAEMTKIATLRLASAYIRSLQDILDGNAPEDTCSWVLATILDSPSSRAKETQKEDPSTKLPVAESSPHPSNEVALNSAESEFVSLLCDSSNSQVFEDSLASYLTPGSEPDPVAVFLSGTFDAPPGCYPTTVGGGAGQQGASLVT